MLAISNAELAYSLKMLAISTNECLKKLNYIYVF